MAGKTRTYGVEGRKAVVGTIDEAALFLGLSGRQVQNWIAQGCPAEKGRYIPADMLAWAIKSGPWRPADPADPLMGGGDSVWLEKYRRERALMARMERRVREGELARLSDLMPMLMDGAAVVRQAGEAIGREYGPTAQAAINEAVEEFVRRLRQTEGGRDGGGV